MSIAQHSAERTRSWLLGSWSLVSWKERDEHGEEIYPLGPDAVGQLMYDSAGRMSAQLASARQPKFADEDWQRASTEEKSIAWSNYFGYFGTYSIDEQAGAVKHHIVGSWFPNLVGGEQIRYFRFEGDRLVLDADTPWGHVEIIWRKTHR